MGMQIWRCHGLCCDSCGQQDREQQHVELSEDLPADQAEPYRTRRGSLA